MKPFMLIKDNYSLANILDSIEKIENYIASILDSEEIWQIIENWLPKLELYIQNLNN